MTGQIIENGKVIAEITDIKITFEAPKPLPRSTAHLLSAAKFEGTFKLEPEAISLLERYLDERT